MKIRNLVAAAAVAVPLGLLSTTVLATPVALELTLVIDVSGSVDATEYALQRTGYVNAFKDAGIQAQIVNSTGGDGIAVRVIEFSTSATQIIGWTHIKTAADSNNFAAAILAALNDVSGSGSTNIVAALNLATSGITANNGFEGRRTVVDVSGDGSQNVGCSSTNGDCATNTRAARDAAVLAGATVNGLPILGSEGGLLAWYTNNVQSAGGFTLGADSFADFSAAVASKISREITGEVPAPATLVLFGAALLGLAGLRRKA